MNKHKPNVEEQSHEAVAAKVITPKRRYFLPAEGVSVEAEDAQDAVAKAKTAKAGNKKVKE